jgi:hypothetical protein
MARTGGPDIIKYGISFSLLKHKDQQGIKVVKVIMFVPSYRASPIL